MPGRAPVQTKGMIFPSLSFTFSREASFFSKKSKPSGVLIIKIIQPCLYLAVQILKSTINPPKKVANAYSLFYMEKYPEFKNTGTIFSFLVLFLSLNKFLDMKITEISKELGKQWNGLSSELKSVQKDLKKQLA